VTRPFRQEIERALRVVSHTSSVRERKCKGYSNLDHWAGVGVSVGDPAPLRAAAAVPSRPARPRLAKRPKRSAKKARRGRQDVSGEWLLKKNGLHLRT
jgi:hypothetical protein